MTEATIQMSDPHLALPLFGARDQHLRRLNAKFKVHITHRNGQIKVNGDDDKNVASATDAIEQLSEIIRRRGNLTPALFEDCLLYTSPSPRDATLSRMPSSA